MNSKLTQLDNSAYRELKEKLQSLEQRVTQLEDDSNEYYASSGEEESLSFELDESSQAKYESKIGEYGLAWFGNIVLFLGISFFVQYLLSSGFKVLSPVFGFASVAGLFVLTFSLRDTHPYMAKMLRLNAFLLVFYVSLRLHFFSANPIISSKAVVLILLLLITAVLVFFSIRRKLPVAAGLGLVLLAVTAILSDSTHVMLPLASLISIIGVVFLYRFAWIRLVFLSVFLAYILNLFWLINNPLMGHQIQIITNPQYGFIYLFLVAAIFSLIALVPAREESYSTGSIIRSIVFNGFGFIFLIALFMLSFFKDNYALPSGAIALYCLVYSIIIRLRSNWKIIAGLYALLGFVALSLSLYGFYGFPRAYFLLAIQSLLVVSMAIWFRSKFIVVMNSVLFIILLVVYLSISNSGNGMNISLSVVALATARILNWKKERLTIRTELIRNFYLIIAFLMVLYTLYHLMPAQYITLSWTMAAMLYFLMSLILNNVKYRYMTMGNLVAAGIFFFMVDLARIDLTRVIALLFLAIVSIGLSFYYVKKRK